MSFSPAIQLIIESCKTTQDRSKIIDLISQISDWDKFIDIAYVHGVFPLVYKTLKDYDRYIDQIVLKNMKSYNIDIVKQNMLMSAELIKVMKLLEENNIEAIAFKGPALAQMAYGDITLRQYCDLDILIKEEDVYKVYKLFKKDFRRSLHITSAQEKKWFKYAHDLGLINKNGIHIEFHWRMLDSDHPVNLNDIDFFYIKNFITIKNQAIQIISNEEFLVYLCIHGSKHMFERIEWIIDIDKFITSQNINWDKFNKLLDNKNYKRFVELGLYLANFLFDTPINRQISNDKNISIVKIHIFNLWSNTTVDFNNKNNIKYMLKLFSNYMDKLKYIHKIYLKPTFTEYRYINLPEFLYILYYPVRQYLLMKKYFSNKNM
jgi:hypothetical protein